MHVELRGVRISPGLARGTAWITGDILETSVGPARIEARQVDAEWERIRQAFARAREDLEESARRVKEQLAPSLAEIFHAHQLMLDGVLASPDLEDALRSSLLSASEAVRTVFRRWEARFQALEGESFQERGDDIRDLGRRVLRELEGPDACGLRAMPAGSVLVTQRLLPSDVVSLSRRSVAAIIVESLGPGSHAALLAREKSIPVVAEIPDLLAQIRRGDELLVDAFLGTVVVAPEAAGRREFEERIERHQATLVRCRVDCHKPAVTRDGHAVTVEANAGAREDIELVVDSGADGVGLLRIEQLYLSRELPLSESELLEDLRELSAPLRHLPLTIRLLDVGGDKAIPSIRLPAVANPALGKRGVRLLLDYPELTRTQLRALLHLSSEQRIRLLVPMITDASDFRRMRELATAVAGELGIPLPPLGAMIETPAAALTVESIASDADFLCVGTNDLTQYTMAAGRDDATVSRYYVDDHPALLRLLGMIAAGASGKPITICGELAGREEAVPALLRLGFRGLSIAPSLIPTIKVRVRATFVDESATSAPGVPEPVTIESPCAHASDVKIRAVSRPAEACEDCVPAGGRWINLRTCLSCGHVGCCDSSPNRHARRHFEQTGHPVMTSSEPGETWVWCFAHDRGLSA